MSGNHKFVLAILFTMATVVGVAYSASGMAALLLAVLILVMTYLLKPLIMPAGYGKNKIRMFCVSGSLGLAAAWGGWAGFANELLSALWSSPSFSFFPGWLKDIRFSEQPSLLTLMFVFAVILVVNYFMRDTPIGGGHPIPLDNDFPEESFKRKLEAFCNAMHRDLIITDQKSNWSPEYYTELQAEVEILSSNGMASRRRIVNLQEAIRKDRHSQAFLILGVPGAGKSVALRKLARDMFDEVGTSSRIPIYINLREWVRPTAEQTPRSQFEVSELEAFVVDSLRRRGDVFTEEFVDTYFRKLWRSGRLFFIFDSFDEMSALLDADEDSDVIHLLSDVISRFISSHPLSRGVLASRVFRRPTQAFQAQKVLEIRPLSEASISDALSRYPEFEKSLRKKLFAQRPDLIPLARNPFMMALLGSWVKAQHDLPANQPQIFEGYINVRLDSCSHRLKRSGLSVERVKAVAVDVAWFVFSSSVFGLEAPVKLISEHFKSEEVDAVLDLLDYARIARVTQGEDKSFAFVHRRFMEYFVTVKLLSQPEDAPIAHIPTDSRGRDALVLYSQLCDESEARRIALLCWKEITTNFSDEILRLRAIHCLRFLIDAFGSRRGVIASFEKELSSFVMEHVTHGDNLIMAKICLEATGLLSESKAVPVLLAAIKGPDSWLRETAFRACRQLPRMDPALAENIAFYVTSIPDLSFWNNRKSILLSLSLSDALNGVHRAARVRLGNIKVSIGSALLVTSIVPGITGGSVLYSLLISLLTITALKTVASNKKKTSEQSVRKRNFYTWLAEISFLDAAVPLTRIFLGTVLLTDGFLYLLSISRPFNSALSCPWQMCEFWRDEFKVLFIVLGLLLIDWALIGRLVSYVIKNDKFISIVKSGVAVVLSIVAIQLILLWAKSYPSIMTVLMHVGFVGISIGAILITWKICIASWRWLQDFRKMKAILLPSSLERSEIALRFSEFATPYGQLRFVRELEQERVSATGHWPIDFKLSVGQGEAICALARLEERWLRLDR